MIIIITILAYFLRAVAAEQTYISAFRQRHILQS
jgi:hypothetical protein